MLGIDQAHYYYLSRIAAGKKILGFQLVYQGGHHNIYCNGRYHIRTGGGTCHDEVDDQKAMKEELRRFTTYEAEDGREMIGTTMFSCDCEAWTNGEGLQGRIYAVK